MDNEIVEIDLTEWSIYTKNKEKQINIIKKVEKALEADGFFIVKTDEYPFDILLETLRETNYYFFEKLTLKEKNKCSYRAPVPRGYSGNKKENFSILSGNKYPNDLVEKFRMGPPKNDEKENIKNKQILKNENMMFYPNKWPGIRTESNSKLINYQKDMELYYDYMSKLAFSLLNIFERVLDLNDGHLVNKCKNHTSILSANYYPPIKNQNKIQKNQLRLAKHTDIDLFTILAPDPNDSFGGLRMLKSFDNNNQNNENDEKWIRIPSLDEKEKCKGKYRSTSFVVNIGDCFNYWTNNKWKSACHKVVIPDTKEEQQKPRLSIGFFFSPDFDANISILSSCITNNDKDKFVENKEMTYVEWRKNRIKQALNSK